MTMPEQPTATPPQQHNPLEMLFLLALDSIPDDGQADPDKLDFLATLAGDPELAQQTLQE